MFFCLFSTLLYGLTDLFCLKLDLPELQAAVDAARERINIPREAIRQKFLDAEKLRLEEIERQNAALKAEQDAKAPKGGKKSGKKSVKK